MEEEDKLSSKKSNYNKFIEDKDKEALKDDNQNDIHNKLTECIDNNCFNIISNPNDRMDNVKPSQIIAKNQKPSKKKTNLTSVNPNSKYYSSTNSKVTTDYCNKKRERSQYQKKFPEKKLGRKTNEEKEREEKGKHTNNFPDLRIKIYSDCLKNLHVAMNDLSLKNYGIILYSTTLSPLLNKNNKEFLKEFPEYTVKQIFLFSKQINVGENYSENIRENIENILQKEEENKIEKIKLLQILFKKKFKEILLMYLNDYPFVNHFDGYSEAAFFLKNFKTVKYSFPDVKVNHIENLKNLLK